MNEQISLFTATDAEQIMAAIRTKKVKPMSFPGVTYEAKHDRLRLTGMHEKVFSVMSDGKFRTLWQIQAAIRTIHCVHYSETAISARLRSLRLPKYGGFTLNLRRKNGKGGTFEYQITA